MHVDLDSFIPRSDRTGVHASSYGRDMDTKTGNIVADEDGDLAQQFKKAVSKTAKIQDEVEREAAPVPEAVPIPGDQLPAVRKMGKERRQAWAKSEFRKRVERKRQRKARKANRNGKSR